MLKAHLSETSKQAVVEHFNDKAQHLVWYHPLKFDVEGTFPSSKTSIYSKTLNGAQYWLGALENLYCKINYIFSCDGVFRTEDFLEAFEEFSVKHSVFNKNNLPVIVANRKYIQALENYNAEKKLEINSDHYPCYLFYMTAEQRELILNEKIPELPQGYTLDTPNLDEDAETMTKTWKYSEDGGLEQTKLKLECFPSVCIRFKGKLAGFYMYEHLGYLNHQLVFEEHRGKGLGAILELVLSQKCIRHGINVCKLVEIGNAPVIAATKRSKYWTTAKEEDGNDVVIDFWNIDA